MYDKPRHPKITSSAVKFNGQKTRISNVKGVNVAAIDTTLCHQYLSAYRVNRNEPITREIKLIEPKRPILNGSIQWRLREVIQLFSVLWLFHLNR